MSRRTQIALGFALMALGLLSLIAELWTWALTQPGFAAPIGHAWGWTSFAFIAVGFGTALTGADRKDS